MTTVHIAFDAAAELAESGDDRFAGHEAEIGRRLAAAAESITRLGSRPVRVVAIATTSEPKVLSHHARNTREAAELVVDIARAAWESVDLDDLVVR